ncbi:DMT family transporter [Candidatus Binatia bacterium]|nr:DMT family transporter [Candidatus Binatia bacterium]
MTSTSAVSTPAVDVAAERLAYVGLAVSSACWASAFVIGKLLMAELPPLPVAALRYVLAALMLLPFAARQRGELRHAGGAWGALAVMIVCGGMAYQWLFLVALVHTTAANTSLLIALNPVFTVLAAPLIGEPLSRDRLAGVVLALAGAAIVITHGDLEVVRNLAFNVGDVVALGAALSWTAFNLASRRAVTRMSPALVNFLVYALGALVLAVAALPGGSLLRLGSASPGALAGIAAMALLSSVLAGQLFLVGVRRVGVGRTVVFIYLIPVLTAALSTTLLHEPFGPAQAAGGAAVLAGVYWTTRTKRRPA